MARFGKKTIITALNIDKEGNINNENAKKDAEFMKQIAKQKKFYYSHEEKILIDYYQEDNIYLILIDLGFKHLGYLKNCSKKGTYLEDEGYGAVGYEETVLNFFINKENNKVIIVTKYFNQYAWGCNGAIRKHFLEIYDIDELKSQLK